MSVEDVVVSVIHTNEIIKDINNLGEQANVTFECPLCKESKITCTYPRCCYLSEFAGGAQVECKKCERIGEVVFHCNHCEHADNDNYFDYCLECGMKYLNIFDNTIDIQIGNKEDSINTNIANQRLKLIQKWMNIIAKCNNETPEINDRLMSQSMKTFENNSIKKYFDSQTKEDNKQRLDLTKQVIKLNIPIATIDPPDASKSKDSSVSVFNTAFNQLMDEIKSKYTKPEQLFESIRLYNDTDGLVADGNDLKTAIKNKIDQTKSESDKNVNLLLVSDICYLSKEKTAKMLKLKNLGYDNDRLNYFKLLIYNWDIDETIKYYKKDKHCIEFYLNSHWNFTLPTQLCEHSEGDEPVCTGEHSLSISEIEERVDLWHELHTFGKYIIYLRENNLYTYRGGNDIEKTTDSFLCCRVAMVNSKYTVMTSPIDHFQSEKYFIKSLELYKDNHWAHIWYANFLFEMKRFDEFEQHYQTALSINNTHDHVYFWFAQKLYTQKRYKKSLEQIKKAIEICKEDKEYQYWLGLIYFEGLKDFAQGYSVFKKFFDGIRYSDDALSYKDENWEGISPYNFENGLKMYHYCGINQFNIADVEHLDTFKIKQRRGIFLTDLEGSFYDRVDKYNVYALACGYLRGEMFDHGLNGVQVEEFGKIMTKMITGLDTKDHIFYNSFDITSNIMKCIQFNKLYFAIFDYNICEMASIFSKIPENKQRQSQQSILLKILQANNSNIFEFGIIGIKNQVYIESDICTAAQFIKMNRLSEYSFKNGIHELITHYNVSSVAYYIHINENNSNSNCFYTCNNDHTTKTTATTKKKGKLTLLKTELNDLSIDSKNDQFQVRIEYECKLKEIKTTKDQEKDKDGNKEQNMDNDSEQESDVETEKEYECNQLYHLSFFQGNKMLNKIGKVKLDMNSNLNYYFLFGCVPTSSWFRIQPTMT